MVAQRACATEYIGYADQTLSQTRSSSTSGDERISPYPDVDDLVVDHVTGFQLVHTLFRDDDGVDRLWRRVNKREACIVREDVWKVLWGTSHAKLIPDLDIVEAKTSDPYQKRWRSTSRKGPPQFKADRRRPP